jgi:hypothetical protein
MFTPTKTEFLELAKHGNLIPVYREIIADAETPVSAYQKMAKSGGSFLFESVEGGEHIGRYSFIGSHPRKVIRVDKADHGDPLQAVENEMAQYKPVAIPGLPRFTGGAVGFLGYEYIHQIEPSVPKPERDDLHTPVLCFMITDTILIFDRVSQTLKVVANAHIDGKPEAAYASACARIDEIIHELQQPLASRAVEFRKEAPEVHVDSNMTPERHAEMVAKAQEYIRAGRHHSGGAGAAVPGEDAYHGIGHLSRVAVGEPVAVHVPARFRRVSTRGRVAGSARALRRGQGGDSADCRDAMEREDARGRCATGERVVGRRKGAGRTFDAGGPRAQRHRTRVRFRQRARAGIHGDREVLARDAHRQRRRGHGCSRAARRTISCAPRSRRGR